MNLQLRKPSIHTLSPEAIGWAAGMIVTGSLSLTVNWVANVAVFVPFTLERSIHVKRMFTINGTSINGNVDVGIHTFDSARIISSGSVAQAGTSVAQYIDITDTYLSPGWYYMSIALSSSTGRIAQVNALNGRYGGLIGLRQMATAFPIPANPTFASSNLMPFVGMELAVGSLL